MVRSPTLRWSVRLLLCLTCLVDAAWGSRFDVISPLLKSFRVRKRQGGTPGPVPQSSIPSTLGYPGLGPCVWASTNPWEGCGLNNDGALGYNASNCNLPTTNVEGLSPPYKNCVAIAWFKFENWANSEYQASTPTIPLSKNYNYALSISTNVIMNRVDVYNGKSGSKNYDKVSSQTINNQTTIFTFQLSRDGIVHIDIKYDYGHPSGNVTLWQQPKDLSSVSSYASLFSLSTSTSQSYPIVSTAYTITTGTLPIISLGTNSSISSTSQFSISSTSSYDALDVNLNSTGSLPSLTPAPMNSTTMLTATNMNSSTSLPSMSPAPLSSNGTLSAIAAFTSFDSITNSTSTMNSSAMPFMPNVSTTAPPAIGLSSRPENSTMVIATLSASSSVPDPSPRPANITTTTRGANSTIVPLSQTSFNSSVLAPSIKFTNSSSALLAALPTNSSVITPSRPSRTPTASIFYNATVVSSFSSSSNRRTLRFLTTDLPNSPGLLSTGSSTIPKYSIDDFSDIPISSVADSSSTQLPLTTDASSIPMYSIDDSPDVPISVAADPSSTQLPLTTDASTIPMYSIDDSPITPSSVVAIIPPSTQILPPTTNPPATPTSLLIVDTASAVPVGIPLWGRCGPNIGQVCADRAECICRDQYWSQCRIQIDGLWAPRGANWQCNGPRADVGNQATGTAAVATATATLAATGPILPLWYQCGAGIQGTCAEGTACICQNAYYSQCRMPIGGQWAGGNDWDCTAPGQLPPAS